MQKSVKETIDQAKKVGLIDESNQQRVIVDVDKRLLDTIKVKYGVHKASEIIEFALLKCLVVDFENDADDNFLKVFNEIEGTVDKDIKLGFED